MSRNTHGRSMGATSGKPSRIYVIFVIVMAAFLVIGSLALVVGSALFDDDGEGEPNDVAQQGAEIARLETQVAEDPDDTGSMAVLANILANSGRLEEAVGWYERAVDGDPENGDLRLAFGLTLFQLGNDFDAEIQFRRAHELIPDSASPPFYLGQLFERRNTPDLDAARHWYERAVEIAPDSLVGEQASERLRQLDSPDVTPTP